MDIGGLFILGSLLALLALLGPVLTSRLQRVPVKTRARRAPTTVKSKETWQ